MVVIGCSAFAARADAEVKLPPVISDHMVLQRDAADPVWGTATPGDKITVKFRDQEKTAEAGKDGKWLLKLDGLKAGGPDDLTITEGSKAVTIHDVLVGDVWVGSGQSNMAMGASSYVQKDELLAKNVAAGPYTGIHVISPQSKGWRQSTPENLDQFSALLFSFGMPLQKELNVPVGLMVGAVGGTPSGAWLSPEAFEADAACKEQVQQAIALYHPEEEQKKYEQQLADYEKAAAAAKADGKKPPGKPALPGKPGEFTGGRKVGFLYDANIKPYEPYAIRGVLWDQGESGTAIRGVDQYTLMAALIRGWRKEWAEAGGQPDFPFLYIQKPSGGGCAWDEGDPITAQAEKFAPLPPKPPGDNDGVYRDTHVRIRQVPGTFMVTATDLGSGTHPINKSGYGQRASRVALGAVYSQKIEFYGPVFDSAKVDGDNLRITFTHVGQGLAFRHGDKLQGFEIAGDDKKFYWADARIDGDAVVLHSDKVAKPAAARYAWSQSHPWANLFNKDGLPAATFRTDAW
jgi:sialate O-acetylesterase